MTDLDLGTDEDTEISEKARAVQESAEAHREATGHDRIDAVQVGWFPAVLVVSCSACGQHLGTVRRQ